MDFPGSQQTAEYWRTLAKEARKKASEMRDVDAKRTMEQVAEMYDFLADQFARRKG